jgi:hypothetical protein
MQSVDLESSVADLKMRIQEHAGIPCKEQHIFGPVYPSGECGEEELPDRSLLKTHLKKHLECGTPPELFFRASPSTAFELLKVQGMPWEGGQIKVLHQGRSTYVLILSYCVVSVLV